MISKPLVGANIKFSISQDAACEYISYIFWTQVSLASQPFILRDLQLSRWGTENRRKLKHAVTISVLSSPRYLKVSSPGIAARAQIGYLISISLLLQNLEFLDNLDQVVYSRGLGFDCPVAVGHCWTEVGHGCVEGECRLYNGSRCPSGAPCRGRARRAAGSHIFVTLARLEIF